jgi:hypothetical protein
MYQRTVPRLVLVQVSRAHRGPPPPALESPGQQKSETVMKTGQELYDYEDDCTYSKWSGRRASPWMGFGFAVIPLLVYVMSSRVQKFRARATKILDGTKFCF